MALIVALAAGALAALWYVGALTEARLKWLGIALAGAAALRLLMTGQTLGALAVGAIATWLALGKRRTPAAEMTPEDAGRLLGVGPDAGAHEVNAAWRRQIAAVHPDKGGNAEASARVNAARDTLLKHLRATGR